MNQMWMQHAKYDGDCTVEIKALDWNGPSHTWYFNTVPQGDWTEITFSPEDDVSVVSFLNCMVERTSEVLRKMAYLCVQRFEGASDDKMRRVLDRLAILDPTFEPPIFNMKCGWQMELLRSLAMNTSARVIGTCRNRRRLNRYIKALQAL